MRIEDIKDLEINEENYGVENKKKIVLSKDPANILVVKFWAEGSTILATDETESYVGEGKSPLNALRKLLELI